MFAYLSYVFWLPAVTYARGLFSRIKSDFVRENKPRAYVTSGGQNTSDNTYAVWTWTSVTGAFLGLEACTRGWLSLIYATGTFLGLEVVPVVINLTICVLCAYVVLRVRERVHCRTRSSKFAIHSSCYPCELYSVVIIMLAPPIGLSWRAGCQQSASFGDWSCAKLRFSEFCRGSGMHKRKPTDCDSRQVSFCTAGWERLDRLI